MQRAPTSATQQPHSSSAYCISLVVLQGSFGSNFGTQCHRRALWACIASASYQCQRWGIASPHGNCNCWSRSNNAVSACRCRAHFGGLLQCTAAVLGSDRKCTHAPRLPGRAAASLARVCVADAIVRLWDCWSRTNDAMSARRRRAHCSGSLLCTAAVLGSGRKCTQVSWLPGTAAALLAAASPGAVLAASERRVLLLEPRKRYDTRVQMPRAFWRLASVHSSGAWERSQMHARTAAAGQSCSFARSRLRC